MQRKTVSRLPTFIVVGPPRTATTWLDKALRRHVGLPDKTKETLFFARNYGKGFAWYTKHFRRCASDQVVGEICAAYFENPQARERIHASLPGCKIICTLRDPVERLYSYYKLMRHNGQTELSFEDAVFRHDKMLASSRYASLLREWHNLFGAENVLVALNDDLVADSQTYLDRITDFIGTSRITVPQSLATRNRENTIETAPRSAWLARRGRSFRSWLGSHQFYRTRTFFDRRGVWRFCSEGGERFLPLDHALKYRLQQLLESEIEQLEELIGRDLANWKGTRAEEVQVGHSGKGSYNRGRDYCTLRREIPER